MALWLELIPKIHRSDQLDRRFHLLDDHDNETTFERDGTRQLLLDDERHHTTTTTTISITSTSASSTPHPPLSSDVRRVPVAARSTRPTLPRPATTPERAAGGSELAKVGGSLDVVELASANAPLSVTVAVGCSLLLLNVAVFVVVCRQKRRAARLKLGASAARFRSRDELKHGGGSAGGVDTESAGFDSNRSSVSSYSLAASVQHGVAAADYSRCRNVRFCEAHAGVTSQDGRRVVTSQDGGSSVFAARRLPPRPGRDNDVQQVEGTDNDLTSTSNHLHNPSTTV